MKFNLMDKEFGAFPFVTIILYETQMDTAHGSDLSKKLIGILRII